MEALPHADRTCRSNGSGSGNLGPGGTCRAGGSATGHWLRAILNLANIMAGLLSTFLATATFEDNGRQLTMRFPHQCLGAFLDVRGAMPGGHTTHAVLRSDSLVLWELTSFIERRSATVILALTNYLPLAAIQKVQFDKPRDIERSLITGDRASITTALCALEMEHATPAASLTTITCFGLQDQIRWTLFAAYLSATSKKVLCASGLQEIYQSHGSTQIGRR
eukprot:13645930-Alexandrium_andersonii.AAC.1